jgi:hypothetical protein
MRGHYYDNFSGRAIGPTDAPTLTLQHRDYAAKPVTDRELTEDRNARENKAKQDAGNGPQIIVSPETPAGAEDVRAIVRAIALQVLRSELDYHGLAELAEHYPALNGIRVEQVYAVIREDLA